jgi:hypothetical protein
METMLLYRMKHQFRSRIELVKKEQVVANLETGRRTATQSVYLFDAVFEVTNNWLTRTFNRTDIDVNTKGWLIDPRDLPDDGYTPSVNDVVQDYGLHSTSSEQWNTTKGVYLIRTVEEVTGGLLVIAQRIGGSDQSKIVSPTVVDDLQLTEEHNEE